MPVKGRGGGRGQSYIAYTPHGYFRKENLDIWEKLLKAKSSKVSSTRGVPHQSSLFSQKEGWNRNLDHIGQLKM